MSVELLADVSGQSEHIHVLITQSAEELRAVNTAIRHALASSDPPPGMESALERNEAVIRQLKNVSEKVIGVKQALQIEIRDRTIVNHQLAAAQEQEVGSRSAALHDKLTTLPSRVLFNDRLEHGIAQAKRHRWILAVMFVDLDRFKSINDTYGHQAGDAVLQTVAMRLKHTTREDDTISRFGGDEFLCVLTQLHEKSEVAMIAGKLLKAIQAPCDLQVGDVIVNPCIEASIGIALFPKDGISAGALVKRADEAMYGAKESKSGFAFAQ
jgi:diguanylate cyclase (GGDEF)-like protein